MDKMRVFYYRHHKTLDIITPSYTCLIKEKGGPLHIFSKDSEMADIILYPDAGFSPEKGNFYIVDEPETVYDEMESMKLNYSCADNIKTTITFYADRIEMKAKRECGESVVPQSFYIGRGSKLFSKKLFTPSWPDETLPIGHYLRLQEPIVLSPGLMSPAPWCFASQQDNNFWIGYSLEPEQNELDFVSFGSQPSNDFGFCWKINYNGCRPACSEFDVPTLVFRFSLQDEFEVFSKHTQTLLEAGKIGKPKAVPDWHKGVSACGWRWQNSDNKCCTQELYEKNLEILKEHKLDCDILIIDDFWGDTAAYGIWKADESRWPDLRGFIDSQHEQNRHVLLWLCTLTTGLPDGEKVSNGLHNIDSTNWLARLKEDVHRLFSDEPGCYNADGVKFDFTAMYPDKPECSHYGVGYILERFKIIYNAIKEVKSDAMILCQSINPYFNQYQTAIRLNDFTALPEQGLEEMKIRYKIAKAVGCGLPVDPDHICCGHTDYKGGYDFCREIDSIGCVSLYLKESDLADHELAEILKCQVDKNLLRKNL